MPGGTEIVARVVYCDGQVMTANDLRAEQTYRSRMGERHAATHHAWGVASGLALTVAGSTVQVAPGTAVDAYGRHLIVPQTVVTPTDQFVPDEVSLWLLHAIEPGTEKSRVREVTRLRFTAGTPAEPRQPDTDAGDWPVFLGTLKRPDAKSCYEVNTQGRPWIALVGEAVRAASGAAHMRCWPHFVVGLREPGIQELRFQENMSIDSLGNLSVAGNAVFGGSVKVQPGTDPAPPGKAGVSFTRANFPPAQPAPWNIYRATVPRDAAPSLNQWVLELEGAGEMGDPGGQTASMGCASQAKFASCLKVACGGDVIVAGYVRVGGRMFERRIPAGSSISVPTAGAIVSPGLLSLKLDAPRTSKLGSVPYTLTFTNNSEVLIRVSSVQEIVTVNEQLSPGPRGPVEALEVEPGKAQKLERLCPAQEPGVLKIAVHAWGTDARTGAVAASASAQIHVTSGSDGRDGH